MSQEKLQGTSIGINIREFFAIIMLTINSRTFIEERMGRKYVEGENIDFYQSYQESGPSTPIFFILSPGVDPLKVGKLFVTYLQYTLHTYIDHIMIKTGLQF